MAMSTNLNSLSKLADIVGFSEAITLSAFYARGGARTYIGTEAKSNHLIAKLIGLPAYKKLVDVHGGEYIYIPELDISAIRDAGLIYRLLKKGFTSTDIAQVLNLNRKTIAQVKTQLSLEGFRSVADELPVEESEAERV